MVSGHLHRSGVTAIDKFDFIIVGAGSAGCILAERLSADPQKRVLLLEAGGSDARFWIRTPIGYGKTFFDASLNWKYSTEPDPGTGGRISYWPRGKVLGGSGSINAMVYHRGLAADYDEWRDVGNPGWGWSDVEQTYRSLEHRVDADGSVQGYGPLWVTNREREYHGLKHHFLDAAREIGLPFTSDFNGDSPEGVGAYAITTRKGLRWSSADAFLKPARRRPNLIVRTDALARRIVFQGRRAAGVEYTCGNRLFQAFANSEVLVCAGAVNSPQLLQLSGIGPGRLLHEMGIPVVHDNPAVGGGLRDHLGINYLYRSTEATLNGVLGSWAGRLGVGIQFLLQRKGPLSLSINQMGGLVRASMESVQPDVQLYFSPISYSTQYAGERRLLLPDPYPGFIIGFNGCRPTSTGRIDIASPNPRQPPRIVPNYLSTQEDVRGALAGARLVGRLERSAAMRKLIAGGSSLDLSSAADELVLEDFRQRCGTVYHPCGTCAMRPEGDRGVVDPQLRVYGIDGLRVVDASVFPDITSANTNAPTMMVARMAAGFITHPRQETTSP